MKLSDLEKLVAVMRAHAKKMNVEDPNVEFYEDSREALLEAHKKGAVFMNMEPVADAAEKIGDHVCVTGGDVAKRGDFAIPLKLC